MTTNRFGLSRHIPSDIALEVRRRSKLGCVICRCAIYQYEHIDPEFTEAREHNPDHICLLCGGCHDRVTRGRLSKQTVREAYLNIQNSTSVKRPFEEFDLSTQSLSVSIGASTFIHTNTLFCINGEDILAITPPQNEAKFPTLNGIFYDRFGKESLRITDNIWEGQSEAWDIEIVGTRVTIKTDGGQIALQIDIAPPDKIHIRKLDMYKDSCHLLADDSELCIGQIHKETQTYIGLSSFQCMGSRTAIAVDSRTIGKPVLTGLQMIGGQGIILDGTGIRVGVGAGSMTIGRLRLWLI
ncbi:hypothetical protein [Thiorhodovibrio frisius]|uniref:HNH endonuclease n=1 Tax=Thiorhodovibrio frisius TaxID=631362 RepID=H8Z462_9GAMM|nr:hypothetical protein [Thiorhodovibrio frisius]EIC21148.1 hypothetical protein Thi970DRAFT_04838 [Thiorhodovibrio frisius]WPL22209.1 hypothetical protein Thiofri_02369 [Thiorhodovibrio frisius]